MLSHRNSGSLVCQAQYAESAQGSYCGGGSYNLLVYYGSTCVAVMGEPLKIIEKSLLVDWLSLSSAAADCTG
jgi:hypothetical protein